MHNNNCVNISELYVCVCVFMHFDAVFQSRFMHMHMHMKSCNYTFYTVILQFIHVNKSVHLMRNNNALLRMHFLFDIQNSTPKLTNHADSKSVNVHEV